MHAIANINRNAFANEVKDVSILMIANKNILRIDDKEIKIKEDFSFLM